MRSTPILWRVEMLGHLSICRDGEELTRFRTQKTAALLAYLAYPRQQTSTRAALVELFWPEHDPEAARNNLSVALSSLRRQMEPPGIMTGSVLISDRATIQLNPLAFSTDIAEFEAATDAAARTQNADESTARWQEAAALYRGSLLPGQHEEWVLQERQRLADAYLNVLRHLVQGLTQQKRYDQALDYAQRAVQADVYREVSHRNLMRLYLAIGRPAAALAQYDEFERILRETMQVTPSAATRALANEVAQQIALSGRTEQTSEGASRASSDDVPAAIPAPRSRPTAASPSGSAAPATPAPQTGRLPLQFTRFFGRENEMEQIQRLVSEPETRLVTLVGLGGSGKTRLATEAALKLYEDFNGRVWFVPLADTIDPGLLHARIRDALSIESVSEDQLPERIAQELRQGRTLLVLDNFEQLAEPCALQVAALLRDAPTLTLMITSRQSLNIAGEQELAVTALPVPFQDGTPERLLEFPSVQLFVDRARARRVDFQLTRQNAGAVTRLCARLEGIPLAIELAAGWAKMLTPQQMLNELESRFDFLVSRRRDLPERHRTLRATLEASYRLLSPELRRFFARLSVFRDGWTREAAEAVGDTPDALSLLWQLQERSLIVAEELETETTEETMRYGMLETLREYASQQLDAEERQQGEQRHVDYFVRFAEQAHSKLRGPEQSFWYQQMEEEHGNIRAALECCRAGRCDTASGIRLTAALWRFWLLRGHVSEGRGWYAALLKQAPVERVTEAELRDALGRAYNGAGVLAYEQLDYDAAQALLEQAHALFVMLESPLGIAHASGNLGIVAYRTGRYAEGQALLDEALAQYQKTGDSAGMCASLNGLGNIADLRQDHVQARAYREQSLALYREMGNKSGISLTLGNLSKTFFAIGDYVAMRRCLEESRALSEELKNVAGLLSYLHSIASMMAAQEQPAEAARLLGAVKALSESAHLQMPARVENVSDSDLQGLRALLGEQRFAEEWEQGSGMTWQQAMEFAGGMGDTLPLDRAPR